MQASTKRILSIGFSGALLIGAAIVYSSFVLPELDSIGKNRGVAASKARALESHTLAVSKVQELIAELRGIEQLRETVARVLPGDPSVTEVLNQLQTIARKDGVELTSFSVARRPFEDFNDSLVRRLANFS